MRIYKSKKEMTFEYFLSLLEISTPYQKLEIKDIQPLASQEECVQVFDQLERLLPEVKTHERETKAILRILKRFHEVRGIVLGLEQGRALDETELFDLKVFLLLLKEYQKISTWSEELVIEERVEKALDILDPQNKRMSTFSVYDLQDKKLFTILEEKREIEARIRQGEDLFSKRQKILTEEKKRKDVLLKRVSEKLEPYGPVFLRIRSRLSSIDLLLAKCKQIQEYNLTRPVFSDRINMQEGVHIQVREFLKKKNQEYMPISCVLEKGVSFLTGANMGGKSVGLETIFSLQLMMQHGFFVPAAVYEAPFFDYVAKISGDRENVKEGLSTFGAEIIQLRQVFYESKDQKGLLLMDELARGTNPTEGVLLIRAVSKYLDTKNVISLITTHYEGAVSPTNIHYQICGLKELSKLKERNLRYLRENMDYRWMRVDHTLVSKQAIEIARLLGLQEEVMRYCEELENEPK